MSRRTQDALTWVGAWGLLLSQLTPWVPHRPEIAAGAFGLLGLPFIRTVQDVVNRLTSEEDKDHEEGAKQ